MEARRGLSSAPTQEGGGGGGRSSSPDPARRRQVGYPENFTRRLRRLVLALRGHTYRRRSVQNRGPQRPIGGSGADERAYRPSLYGREQEMIRCLNKSVERVTAGGTCLPKRARQKAIQLSLLLAAFGFIVHHGNRVLCTRSEKGLRRTIRSWPGLLIWKLSTRPICPSGGHSRKKRFDRE